MQANIFYTIVFESLCMLVNYFHKPLIQKAVDFRTACFETLQANKRSSIHQKSVILWAQFAVLLLIAFGGYPDISSIDFSLL